MCKDAQFGTERASCLIRSIQFHIKTYFKRITWLSLHKSQTSVGHQQLVHILMSLLDLWILCVFIAFQSTKLLLLAWTMLARPRFFTSCKYTNSSFSRLLNTPISHNIKTTCTMLCRYPSAAKKVVTHLGQLHRTSESVLWYQALRH